MRKFNEIPTQVKATVAVGGFALIGAYNTLRFTVSSLSSLMAYVVNESEGAWTPAVVACAIVVWALFLAKQFMSSHQHARTHHANLQDMAREDKKTKQIIKEILRNNPNKPAEFAKPESAVKNSAQSDSSVAILAKGFSLMAIKSPGNEKNIEQIANELKQNAPALD